MHGIFTGPNGFGHPPSVAVIGSSQVKYERPSAPNCPSLKVLIFYELELVFISHFKASRLWQHHAPDGEK